jgi:hypothetical protein
MRFIGFLLMLVLSFNLLADGPLTEKEKSMFIRNVVIPLPSEIILALDNLTDVDWKNSVEYNYSADYEENYQIVLNLGIKVANGFVAIQAEDKKNIGEMFSVSKNLAENFGAKSNLFTRKEEIISLVKSNKWNELRETLDDMQQKIKIEMAKYHPDFVTLASIGGWLQGLNVVSGTLAKDYNDKASTILYQPILVNYFIRKIDSLDGKHSSLPIIQKIKMKLQEIKELSNSGFSNPVNKENVVKLYDISSSLIKEIEKGA